jgi:hypothetical protein
MDPFQWPSGCARLWHEREARFDESQVVLMRRRFRLDAVADLSGRLDLYAEGRFVCWLNGKKIARGPWLHQPERRAVMRCDLSGLVQAGENVLAVLVYSPGHSFGNTVISGEPGLVCNLQVGEISICSDAQWRVLADCGWMRDTPRKGWALTCMEAFDLEKYPRSWQEVDFDEGGWQEPQVLPPSTYSATAWHQPALPPLRFREFPVEPSASFACSAESPRWDAPQDAEGRAGPRQWSDFIATEKWHPVEVSGAKALNWQADPSQGRVLHFDLGNEFTGHIAFRLRTASAGTVEIFWSERLHNGRPPAQLKGTVYADRLVVSPGTHERPFIGYSAFRHVCLVFRGVSGPLAIERCAIEESWLDSGVLGLPPPSVDADSQRIWQICQRTLHCGPQDGMTDCPSREQATYVSDSVLAACWLAETTADCRLLNHVVAEIFAAEHEGLIPDNVYGPFRRSFVDFNLIAVALLQRARAAGLAETVLRGAMPAARRIVDRMLALADDEGLIAVDWQAGHSTWQPPLECWSGEERGALFPWLFIDHPGMGWHNLHDTPVDRAGYNTVVHALLAWASTTLAEVEEAISEKARAKTYRRAAETTRRLLLTRFWDAERQCFPDGLNPDGTARELASEQTNTICLLIGAVPLEATASLIERLLQRGGLPGAENGPSWAGFVCELLRGRGQEQELSAYIRERWQPMLAGGADCAWETFAGDHLDSLCHPWSAAPFRYLAGAASVPASSAEQVPH